VYVNDGGDNGQLGHCCVGVGAFVWGVRGECEAAVAEVVVVCWFLIV
jgi:hypothetical protein